MLFNWFGTDSSEEKDIGLEKIHSEFNEMLFAGRHMFDVSSNAFLGGTELNVIRGDLFSTDKKINQCEKEIRRAIVVHATLHGAHCFPACLILMSLVKDAERIGDYCKNIFDLAEYSSSPPEGEHLNQLVILKDRISTLMERTIEVFSEENHEKSKEAITEAINIEDICDKKIIAIIKNVNSDTMAPTYVLAYRYFKRISSHLRNICSSVIMPLDEIDFTGSLKPPNK